MALPLAAPAIIGLGRLALWGWRAYRGARAAQELAEAVGTAPLGTATAIGQAAQQANEDAEARPLPAEDVCTDCGPDKDPEDEICEAACQCLADRGGARTFTECVAQKLRDNHYDGRYPRAPDADGPRPEVSYRQGPDGRYAPVESRSNPGLPSSAPVVRGAPRPDITWYENGRPSRIYELKFPGDGQTPMQQSGAYNDIARDLGLDPQDGVRVMDIEEDCDCTPPMS